MTAIQTTQTPHGQHEKALMLAEIQTWLQKTPYVIFVDYAGLKVAELSELRSRLNGANACMRVAKNTFLERALKAEQVAFSEEHLRGQTAIVYGQTDAAAAAKVLKNFEAEFKLPKMRGAVMDKTVLLSEKEVLELADLPSREVVLAQLLGLLQTPATNLARLLQAPATQLVRVIQAYADKAGANA